MTEKQSAPNNRTPVKIAIISMAHIMKIILFPLEFPHSPKSLITGVECMDGRTATAILHPRDVPSARLDAGLDVEVIGE